MSYTPKVWVDGEIIYHQDLNRMEEGIQTAILNEEAQRVIDGCLYGGVVTPNDEPLQDNDHRYFYLAFQEGRYAHFNNNYVDSQVCLFYWSESLSNWLMLALWENSESLSTLFSGKADRVNSPTNGHLAGLDSEGNPTDSGIAASEVITTVDNALSSTSENPVQNKVLKSIIDAINAAKQDLLPDGSVFGGFVGPSTVPDTKYYYLTDIGGLYPYFDNTNVNDDSLTLFYYKNNSWQNAIIAPSYQFAVELYAGLEGKQDTISDLDTIRNGAAAGATALQPSDITPIENAISIIESVIPAQASAQNPLADQNFVNSQVTTASANFVGTFETLSELQAVQNPTKNDYGFVIETDALGNQYYDRYKYNGTTWLFEYKVESTAFTAAQWAAIQSGITSALVQKINDVMPANASISNKLATASDVSAKYTKPSMGIPKTDFASDVQTSLGKADTAYQMPSTGIPAALLPSAIRTGSALGATAYQKPVSGIPASDLASAVQTSLGKADTAVQTETDPVFSASPAAGITSGDISNWDSKAEHIPVVDASTIPASMDADKVYQYGTLAGNTTFPSLNTPSDATKAHVYCWTFTTPSTAPTITWPSAITSWAGGSAPTINASKSYEVSVMDGLATIIEA